MRGGEETTPQYLNSTHLLLIIYYLPIFLHAHFSKINMHVTFFFIHLYIDLLIIIFNDTMSSNILLCALPKLNISLLLNI